MFYQKLSRNIKVEEFYEFYGSIDFVDWNNQGGRLVLYWRNSMDLQIDTSSKNHIDAIVNKGKVDV